MRQSDGISLREAAIITALAYLLDPVAYAEISLYPRIVVPHHAAQTFHNIQALHQVFAVTIFFYLINFVLDFVAAWALYILLKPVNKALSLLMAGFRVLYTVLGLFSLIQLAISFYLARYPFWATTFGAKELQAEVLMHVYSFRFGWTFGLIIFGIHLVLLAYLIYRSGYIPKLLGVLLGFLGLGWIAAESQPYFYPSDDFSWFFTAGFSELLFPLWLIVFGWRIKVGKGPDARVAPAG